MVSVVSRGCGAGKSRLTNGIRRSAFRGGFEEGGARWGATHKAGPGQIRAGYPCKSMGTCERYSIYGHLLR